jgi:hypothetical protein
MVVGAAQTVYGLGDLGNFDNRWWVGENGDNEMDLGNSYFLGPLLGSRRLFDNLA